MPSNAKNMTIIKIKIESLSLKEGTFMIFSYIYETLLRRRQKR